MYSTKPVQGLYQKFEVKRIIGEDKPGEQFFVLSPTHDPMARAAMMAYANECDQLGLPDLAAEIRDGLNRVAHNEPFYT